MECEYYVLWYRLDNQDSYLLWFSTDESGDGVFINKHGLSPAFASIESLRNFAKSDKIKVKEEDPLLLNLDVVKNWLAKADDNIEDYNPFLDAWNLFEDVSRSTIRDFTKNQYDEIYERIFWGCNLAAVTPRGESFTPTWTKKELKTIRKIMNSGFKLFSETVEQQ